MNNEEIDHVARIAAITPVKDPLVQALSVRLVELLDAKVVVKPRVWRGGKSRAIHWWWHRTDGYWHMFSGASHPLSNGDIFLPGTAPKPTSPPPPVEELESCSEVDWT